MIDVLDRHGVEFAANQHGATRLTEDLDVCVEWSEANLARLAGALRERDAELAISPGETVLVPLIDARLLSQMQIGTWQTRSGRLDVLKGIPKSQGEEAEFRELARRATNSTVQGREISVAALADVVRSKRIANRPKDAEGLPELERLLQAATRESAEVDQLRRDAYPSPSSRAARQASPSASRRSGPTGRPPRRPKGPSR